MGTVLVDLDSTLCDTRHRHDRSPHAGEGNTWLTYGESCHLDAPIVGTVGLVRLLAAQHRIRIISGRGDVFLEKTIDWLDRHEVPYDSVFLRNQDHPEEHSGYKEMYLREVLKTEDVVLALDDWPTVVEMYHRYGIPCVCINPMYRDDPMLFFSERPKDLGSVGSTLGAGDGRLPAAD